jgi:hypothetical protein
MSSSPLQFVNAFTSYYDRLTVRIKSLQRFRGGNVADCIDGPQYRFLRLKHPARQVHRHFNLDSIPFPSRNHWQYDLPRESPAANASILMIN